MTENPLKIAQTTDPTSVDRTKAAVFTSSDLLHRIVSYGPYLGIVEDVTYSGNQGRVMKIRNLVKLDAQNKPVPVRSAPEPGLDVSFAAADELGKFFPNKKFPSKAYLGRVLDTNYPLPLDPTYLCFAKDDGVKTIFRVRSLRGQPHDSRWHVIAIGPNGEASLT